MLVDHRALILEDFETRLYQRLSLFIDSIQEQFQSALFLHLRHLAMSLVVLLGIKYTRIYSVDAFKADSNFLVGRENIGLVDVLLHFVNTHFVCWLGAGSRKDPK